MNYLFSFILYKCIGISDWAIADDKDGRFYIIDKTHDVKITSPQFDDISRIILYQNIPNYDDAYVSPDVKKLIEETDKVKNGNIEPPTIERKISIISAHTGILKKDQLTMTLRAHQSLFEEVCGEVEFTTTRPIALYAGKANELGHWIYPKKKGKFDGYTVSMGQYKQSFGGDANISQGDGSSNAEKLVEQFYNN